MRPPMTRNCAVLNQKSHLYIYHKMTKTILEKSFVSTLGKHQRTKFCLFVEMPLSCRTSMLNVGSQPRLHSALPGLRWVRFQCSDHRELCFQGSPHIGIARRPKLLQCQHINSSLTVFPLRLHNPNNHSCKSKSFVSTNYLM